MKIFREVVPRVSCEQSRYFSQCGPPCWCISLTHSPKDPLMKLKWVGVSLSLSDSKEISSFLFLGSSLSLADSGSHPSPTQHSGIACLYQTVQELLNLAKGG